MNTNAVRLLERSGIPFELRGYEADADHLDAATAAAKIDPVTPLEEQGRR